MTDFSKSKLYATLNIFHLFKCSNFVFNQLKLSNQVTEVNSSSHDKLMLNKTTQNCEEDFHYNTLQYSVKYSSPKRRRKTL